LGNLNGPITQLPNYELQITVLKDSNLLDNTQTFTQYRPLMFSIAYKMLGSVREAEDIVQDAFLRWRESVGEEIRSPKSYLATIVTRLSIDRLRSAQLQRESYIGPWLPEPLITEKGKSTADIVSKAEHVSMAFLVLLESLSPIERAVFLLREVFDYDYSEIAEIVGKNEANCRQLFRRAKQRIDAGQSRFNPPPEKQQEMVQQFINTIATGDLPGLINLLSVDISLKSDGGGKVAAARKPVLGSEKVAAFLLNLARRAPEDYSLQATWINGRFGIINYFGRLPQSVFSFELEGDQIKAIYATVNPDKLINIPRLPETT
jgi:RNA polymerase sigma-70 factor (ECF subfamily)